MGEESPMERGHQRGVPPLEIVILPLMAHLAWKRLHIDTYLLLIITTTADELYSGTNIDNLERPWTPKIWVLSDFLPFLAATHTYSEFSLKYTGDRRTRQPAYEIWKLMLSRISWALAQISCMLWLLLGIYINTCNFSNGRRQLSGKLTRFLTQCSYGASYELFWTYLRYCTCACSCVLKSGVNKRTWWWWSLRLLHRLYLALY